MDRSSDDEWGGGRCAKKRRSFDPNFIFFCQILFLTIPITVLFAGLYLMQVSPVLITAICCATIFIFLFFVVCLRPFSRGKAEGDEDRVPLRPSPSYSPASQYYSPDRRARETSKPNEPMEKFQSFSKNKRTFSQSDGSPTRYSGSMDGDVRHSADLAVNHYEMGRLDQYRCEHSNFGNIDAMQPPILIQLFPSTSKEGVYQFTNCGEPPQNLRSSYVYSIQPNLDVKGVKQSGAGRVVRTSTAPQLAIFPSRTDPALENDNDCSKQGIIGDADAGFTGELAGPLQKSSGPDITKKSCSKDCVCVNANLKELREQRKLSTQSRALDFTFAKVSRTSFNDEKRKAPSVQLCDSGQLPTKDDTKAFLLSQQSGKNNDLQNLNSIRAHAKQPKKNYKQATTKNDTQLPAFLFSKQSGRNSDLLKLNSSKVNPKPPKEGEQVPPVVTKRPTDDTWHTYKSFPVRQTDQLYQPKKYGLLVTESSREEVHTSHPVRVRKKRKNYETQKGADSKKPKVYIYKNNIPTTCSSSSVECHSLRGFAEYVERSALGDGRKATLRKYDHANKMPELGRPVDSPTRRREESCTKCQHLFPPSCLDFSSETGDVCKKPTNQTSNDSYSTLPLVDVTSLLSSPPIRLGAGDGSSHESKSQVKASSVKRTSQVELNLIEKYGRPLEDPELISQNEPTKRRSNR